jgi:hypothetical protein
MERSVVRSIAYVLLSRLIASSQMYSPSPENGRKKLMLKLPALRAQLRNLAGDTVGELFESYDLATSALDGFRRETSTNPGFIGEYEELCREIEREVSRYCYQNGIS